MNARSGLFWVAVVFTCTIAAAQQRPIFDPDDFVNPHQHSVPVFISNLIAGGAASLIDDYRPIHHNGGFALFTNSIYWSYFQIDYKRSQVSSGGASPVFLCRCPNLIYFPTPPLPGSTPAAPTPGSRDTLQFAWYAPSPLAGPPEGPPVMLRYRLTITRQPIDTVIRAFATGEVISQMGGREQSVGVDADTFFPLGGHDIYGSLFYARTVRSGTTDNRSQSEVAYMSRFPAVALHNVFLRATLTVGGVSGRSGTALNIVNPAFEAFWHDPKTRANFHFVWSPQSTNSGNGGWETHHQVAIFVDRALWVYLFHATKDDASKTENTARIPRPPSASSAP
jgi:hypothetical protein